MSATTATMRGRRAAEALMIDTCTVTRLTGSSTDPETGVITPTTATIYTGKCKIQQPGVASGGPANLGEATVMVSHPQLHLPIAATGVRSDDVATVTAAALDPDLVGRRYAIRVPAAKTFATARRLDIELVTS